MLFVPFVELTHFDVHIIRYLNPCFKREYAEQLLKLHVHVDTYKCTKLHSLKVYPMQVIICATSECSVETAHLYSRWMP